MAKSGRQLIAAFIVAIIAPLAALWLTRLLWTFISPNISPLFFAAVMVTAWYGGLGPALLAIVLSGFASTYLVPAWGVQMRFDVGDLVRVLTFAIVGILISWLNAARARAQQALFEAAKLHGHLQDHGEQLQEINSRLQEEVEQRRRAQEQASAHELQLRHLGAELSLIEERERRRIASELHDNLGQTLAISQMKLESLHAAAPSDEIASELAEVSRLVESAITQTRSLTRELSPPVLYEASFKVAVEWLADQIHKQHKLEIEVDQHGPVQLMSEDIRVFLFQSVRELLHNIVKHAKASSAQVTIYAAPESIRVAIEDDGRGIDMAAMEQRTQTRGSFGLLNIRERLGYLGGHLDVESTPGRGSRFTLIVPLIQERPLKDAI